MARIVFLLILYAGIAQAIPIATDSLIQPIQGSKSQYGLNNFKMVMPNVLYRGGSGNSKYPMTATSAQALCKDGFSQAAYVYDANWNYKTPQLFKCSAGQLTYSRQRWNNSTDVYQILKSIYKIINNQSGPMYVHCWYGIHASGYVAAVALRQFCGLSGEQAVRYWDSNVPEKIQYKKVQSMIRDFKPYPDLLITDEQQIKACPKFN